MIERGIIGGIMLSIIFLIWLRAVLVYYAKMRITTLIHYHNISRIGMYKPISYQESDRIYTYNQMWLMFWKPIGKMEKEIMQKIGLLGGI